MKILEQNEQFTIISEFKIIDNLEVGNYFLNWDGFGNLFLNLHQKPTLPEKIFRSNSSLFNESLIINSFNHYDKNLGVVLSGKKGTSKTVDAKLLCEKLNLPVIHINKKVPINVEFISFLNKIEQSYVLFIDEYEKLFIGYSDNDDKYHSQESFLGFLDGLSFGNKKLFLFTVNGHLNEYLTNRPSRIKYYVDYKGIDKDFAEYIAKSLLLNPEFAQDLVDNVNLKSLTIDILTSIIGEINIHNIPYSKFMNIFNYSELDSDIFEFLFKEDEHAEYESVDEKDTPRFNKTSSTIYVYGIYFTKVKSTNKEHLFKSKENSYVLVKELNNKLELVF